MQVAYDYIVNDGFNTKCCKFDGIGLFSENSFFKCNTMKFPRHSEFPINDKIPKYTKILNKNKISKFKRTLLYKKIKMLIIFLMLIQFIKCEDIRKNMNKSNGNVVKKSPPFLDSDDSIHMCTSDNYDKKIEKDGTVADSIYCGDNCEIFYDDLTIISGMNDENWVIHILQKINDQFIFVHHYFEIQDTCRCQLGNPLENLSGFLIGQFKYLEKFLSSIQSTNNESNKESIKNSDIDELDKSVSDCQIDQFNDNFQFSQPLKISYISHENPVYEKKNVRYLGYTSSLDINKSNKNENNQENESASKCSFDREQENENNIVESKTEKFDDFITSKIELDRLIYDILENNVMLSDKPELFNDLNCKFKNLFEKSSEYDFDGGKNNSKKKDDCDEKIKFAKENDSDESNSDYTNDYLHKKHLFHGIEYSNMNKIVKLNTQDKYEDFFISFSSVVIILKKIIHDKKKLESKRSDNEIYTNTIDSVQRVKKSPDKKRSVTTIFKYFLHYFLMFTSAIGLNTGYNALVLEQYQSFPVTPFMPNMQPFVHNSLHIGKYIKKPSCDDFASIEQKNNFLIENNQINPIIDEIQNNNDASESNFVSVIKENDRKSPKDDDTHNSKTDKKKEIVDINQNEYQILEKNANSEQIFRENKKDEELLNSNGLTNDLDDKQTTEEISNRSKAKDFISQQVSQDGTIASKIPENKEKDFNSQQASQDDTIDSKLQENKKNDFIEQDIAKQNSIDGKPLISNIPYANSENKKIAIEISTNEQLFQSKNIQKVNLHSSQISKENANDIQMPNSKCRENDSSNKNNKSTDSKAAENELNPNNHPEEANEINEETRNFQPKQKNSINIHKLDQNTSKEDFDDNLSIENHANDVKSSIQNAEKEDLPTEQAPNSDFNEIDTNSHQIINQENQDNVQIPKNEITFFRRFSNLISEKFSSYMNWFRSDQMSIEIENKEIGDLENDIKEIDPNESGNGFLKRFTNAMISLNKYFSHHETTMPENTESMNGQNSDDHTITDTNSEADRLNNSMNPWYKGLKFLFLLPREIFYRGYDLMCYVKNSMIDFYNTHLNFFQVSQSKCIKYKAIPGIFTLDELIYGITIAKPKKSVQLIIPEPPKNHSVERKNISTGCPQCSSTNDEMICHHKVDYWTERAYLKKNNLDLRGKNELSQSKFKLGSKKKINISHYNKLFFMVVTGCVTLYSFICAGIYILFFK